MTDLAFLLFAIGIALWSFLIGHRKGYKEASDWWIKETERIFKNF